jgi:hypothetical protein
MTRPDGLLGAFGPSASTRAGCPSQIHPEHDEAQKITTDPRKSSACRRPVCASFKPIRVHSCPILAIAAFIDSQVMLRKKAQHETAAAVASFLAAIICLPVHACLRYCDGDVNHRRKTHCRAREIHSFSSTRVPVSQPRSRHRRRSPGEEMRFRLVGRSASNRVLPRWRTVEAA